MRIIHYYILGLFVGVFSTAINIWGALVATKSSTEIFAIVCAIITASVTIFYIVRIYRLCKRDKNQTTKQQ